MGILRLIAGASFATPPAPPRAATALLTAHVPLMLFLSRQHYKSPAILLVSFDSLFNCQISCRPPSGRISIHNQERCRFAPPWRLGGNVLSDRVAGTHDDDPIGFRSARLWGHRLYGLPASDKNQSLRYDAHLYFFITSIKSAYL